MTTPSTTSVPQRYVLLRKDNSGRAARLLSFDHVPEANQLPTAAEGVCFQIDEGMYQEWLANMATRAWQGGVLMVVPSDVARLVATATIVQRLAAVGKLRAARVAMKFDVPLIQLSDQELELQELWRANTSLYSTNPGARAMLDSLSLGEVGSSTDAILAP